MTDPATMPDSAFTYSVVSLQTLRPHADEDEVSRIDEAIARLQARDLRDEVLLHTARIVRLEDGTHVLMIAYVTPRYAGGRIFVDLEGEVLVLVDDPVKPLETGMLFTHDRLIDESALKESYAGSIDDLAGATIWLEVGGYRSNRIPITWFLEAEAGSGGSGVID